MSTIIIITRPRVANRTASEDSRCDELETRLQDLVDELRGLGYEVEIQRPE